MDASRCVERFRRARDALRDSHGFPRDHGVFHRLARALELLDLHRVARRPAPRTHKKMGSESRGWPAHRLQAPQTADDRHLTSRTGGKALGRRVGVMPLQLYSADRHPDGCASPRMRRADRRGLVPRAPARRAQASFSKTPRGRALKARCACACACARASRRPWRRRDRGARERARPPRRAGAPRPPRRAGAAPAPRAFSRGFLSLLLSSSSSSSSSHVSDVFHAIFAGASMLSATLGASDTSRVPM